MKLLQAGDKPTDFTKEYQFSVISFWKPSDEYATMIHEIVEGAHKYFSKKVRTGVWGKRSVGWFKVDLDVTPELAFYEDKTRSDQAVIGPGIHRFTHFDRVAEKKSENEMNYALVVRDLTGDWI